MTVYIWLALSLEWNRWFKVISGLVILAVGVAYCVLEGIPSISPPANMNPEGLAIGIDEEAGEDAPII